MKLACSSTAFDTSLRNGDLTQLEWIDACANELSADGVVFDVRHFPRTDADYLAQIKKMTTDLGLGTAALYCAGFFQLDGEQMNAHLLTALAIGTPLLCSPAPSETDAAWSDVLAHLGTATSLAKQHNVTLAVRNMPGTFAASTHDMKRISKEADSAWLRYAPDFSVLDAGSETGPLLDKAVLVWQPFSAGPDAVSQLLGSFLGFLALDDAAGLADVQTAKNALRRWRSALFEAVNRT